MIKAVFIDIDGTLLNDQKQVSNKTVSAIQRVQSKRIPITLITGRSYLHAKDYIHYLPEGIPFAFQNGALIYIPSSNKILHQQPFSSAFCKNILHYYPSTSLFPLLYGRFISSEIIYCPHIYNGPFKSYMEINKWRINYSFSDWEQEPFLSQMAFIGRNSAFTSFLQLLHKNNLFPFVVKSMQKGEYGFFELFEEETSKVQAGEFLANFFHVSLKDVLFIGDSFNDIPLMKKVGHPAVVDNAIPELKQLSNHMGPSNNNHGVAWLLNNLVS